MDELTEIKATIALAVGALTGFWGWYGWIIIGWIVCMVMDYITGSAAAAKNGDWDSSKARAGIWHKCGMIVVVMVSAMADLLISAAVAHLPLTWKYPGMIAPIVLVWYIVTELGSITENAVQMGAPVPEWLVRMLAIGKSTIDQAGNHICEKGDEAEDVRK